MPTSPSTAAPHALKKRTPWRQIVLEAFRTLPAGPVRLAALYGAVAVHPDAIERAATNASVSAKVRQVVQRLRDDGEVEEVDKGVWKLVTS